MAAVLPSLHIRPFQAWRDASSVSRLIEICFDMEQSTQRSSALFLDNLQRWMEWSSMPGGYVWEENGEVVGNVSLVRIRYRQRSIGLIANVAVHPSFRRRGIGGALVEKAIQEALRSRVEEIWLQVREDNEGAISLYQRLGFVIRARRRLWYTLTTPDVPSYPAYMVRPTPRAHWSQVKQWFEQLHPEELGWYHQWEWELARPGWEMRLWRAVLGITAAQWTSFYQGQPQATILWHPSPRGENGLWLAYGQTISPQAILPLLWKVRQAFYYRQRTLYLEHPLSEWDETLRAAGFSIVRTLLWMRLVR
jgi:GNAT superfamily N-acetyltransferase